MGEEEIIKDNIDKYLNGIVDCINTIKQQKDKIKKISRRRWFLIYT